jgi:uncharacterized membrane protein YfcA
MHLSRNIIFDNLLSISILSAWILYMGIQNQWYVFEKGWPMTLTMIAGSFVAGSTPLGSGAISYPVMVLVLNIVSNNARTFALMIQSVGMGCASYRIFRTQVDYLNPTSLLYMLWTGMMGFNIGFYLVDLPGDYVKTIYFSLTLALGVFIQSYINRFITSPPSNEVILLPKNLALFIPISMLGGILMSMVGTGFDVVLYIYLRFFHNTEERVTTNHGIIAQAFLAMFGFYNALVIQKNITSLIWTYWLCSVPAVLLFAPLGNYFMNKQTWIKRSTLNYYIYALETFQFIAGFVITISNQVSTIIVSSCILGTTIICLGIRYLFFDNSIFNSSRSRIYMDTQSQP